MGVWHKGQWYRTTEEYEEALLQEKQKPIKIKKSHEGLFTAEAKAAGYDDVQAYAAHVLADKNASPALKKRANFAKNFGGK